MRQPRNFVPDRCYRLISRIANRAFYLGEDERTRFVARMWRVAYFSCVEVLAYCVMSNHFHILAYIPASRDLSEEEVLARVRTLYLGEKLAGFERGWAALVRSGDVERRMRFLSRFTRRMWNASGFMKRRRWGEMEDAVPDMIPRILDHGSRRIARDLLAILADGPRSPSEMRGMLGIASANYFTARYITPMKESGLIAPVNAASLHSPWQAYRLTPKGRKVLS